MLSNYYVNTIVSYFLATIIPLFRMFSVRTRLKALRSTLVHVEVVLILLRCWNFNGWNECWLDDFQSRLPMDAPWYTFWVCCEPGSDTSAITVNRKMAALTKECNYIRIFDDGRFFFRKWRKTTILTSVNKYAEMCSNTHRPYLTHFSYI